MTSLLPQVASDFRTREYWDKFFLERREEAFEWYGKFDDMRVQIEKHVKKDESVLVIGCGNSDFSSELYDCGYRSVRNLDFSELVISEMRTKNQSARPEMHWDVGDMTDMKSYSAGQFDVVFDKGALDALMSVESDEVLGKAADMFREIDRVLSNSGRYICVTLAEPFILKTLVSGFAVPTLTAKHWVVSIEGINTPNPSPFKALIFTIQRSSAPKPLSLFVDQIGRPVVVPEFVNSNDISSKISSMQELYHKSYDLKDIKLDRFESFDVFAPQHPDIPRFSIAIVDADESSSLSCAVLFLPQGRESEYQFATAPGLRAIAGEASCKRLLAVRCNRPHIFPENPAKLQDELDLVVLALKPACCLPEERIPYMAVGSDSSWETIASGESPLSGRYVIEENIDEEGPGVPANSLLRRLIFLQNQHFVQTEVRLLSRKPVAKASGKKRGGGGGKGKKVGGGVGGGGQEVLEFDHTYLDAHHRTMLAGLVLCPLLIHGAMRKGSGASAGSKSTAPAQALPQGLIVGLGGGALPMCLQRYLPGLELRVCDIDGELEAIARDHFGFRCGERCSVVISEGMEFLTQLQQRISAAGDIPAAAVASISISGDKNPSLSLLPESAAALPLDMLVIDVDSKDTSIGLSAPPRSFATRDALETMHSVLRPGGLLAVNVAARSVALFQGFVGDLRGVFSEGRVYTVRGADDVVNVTVIAIKAGGEGPSTARALIDNNKAVKAQTREQLERAEAQARENLLEDLLQASGLHSDPLELSSCLAKLQLIEK